MIGSLTASHILLTRNTARQGRRYQQYIGEEKEVEKTDNHHRPAAEDVPGAEAELGSPAQPLIRLLVHIPAPENI